MMAQKVGLIMGQGHLPALVKQVLSSQGHHIFAIAYRGVTPEDTVYDLEHCWLSLGQIGAMLKTLRHQDITQVLLVGKFYRPKLWTLRPDALGKKLLWRLSRSWFGDDALLRTVLKFFKERGITMLGIQDLLPHLLAKPTNLGQHLPETKALEDMTRGVKVLTALSSFDVGQGLVVQGGQVLAIEAAEGTDACITRGGSLAQCDSNAPTTRPVYVKMAKVGQSPDIDLPVVGPDTLQHLHHAGFQGIGIQSSTVLLLESQKVVEILNKYGLFLWQF